MIMLPLKLISVFASLAVSCAIAQSCSLDPDGNAEHVDVLVLGGGIAGIAAARTLEVNGVSDFLVLEAFDRIGGRIREQEGTTIEVGANWIHGLDPNDLLHHPIWREWVACDPDGPDGSYTPDLTRVYDAQGNRCDTKPEYETRTDEFSTAFDNLEELVQSIDMSRMDNNLDNWIEWENIDLCIGLKPQNISLVIFSQLAVYTEYTEGEDDTEDYLVVDDKGHSYVVQCLARNIEDKIKLNSRVTKIQTADDCVCATVQDNTVYCGGYGIVTFSMGALQAAVSGEENSVQFDPPLPQSKQDAINMATPINYGKVFLVFESTFWEETDEDQQILGYVADERGYYGYFVLDKNRPHTVTVDIADDVALRVARQSEEETVNEIMVILRTIFPNGSDIPEPQRAIISRWPTDPLFRSAYTAYGPGVPTSIFEDLQMPVGRLYFAGEATNDTDYGYTQGGYGTGVNVARDISTLISSNGQGEYYYCIQTCGEGSLFTLLR